MTASVILSVMRKLRHDRSGISEIVGALMLTLIVVVAASSFAVFLSEQQKSVQEQELYNLMKSQESLQIIDFQENYTADGAHYWNLNFTVTSNHAQDSVVSKIAVNGHVAREFAVWRVNQTTGNWDPEKIMKWSDDLTILAKDQMYLRLNSSSLFETGIEFSNGTFVKMEISTTLLNVFTKVFLPPSAIMTVMTQSIYDELSASYKNYLFLDGTGSVAGEGSFMVMYAWNVTKVTTTDYNQLQGVKANFDLDGPARGPGDYKITFIVMDNHGLMASQTVTYTY